MIDYCNLIGSGVLTTIIVFMWNSINNKMKDICTRLRMVEKVLILNKVVKKK